MERPESPSQPTGDGVLEYAQPTIGRRRRVKHALAIAFAVIALGLGVLFAMHSIILFMRSIDEPTTIDKRLFRQDAVKFLACSVVLVIAGVWYARVGLRGEAASDPPGR